MQLEGYKTPFCRSGHVFDDHPPVHFALCSLCECCGIYDYIIYNVNNQVVVDVLFNELFYTEV